jgi:hypothetical protein
MYPDGMVESVKDGETPSYEPGKVPLPAGLVRLLFTASNTTRDTVSLAVSLGPRLLLATDLGQTGYAGRYVGVAAVIKGAPAEIVVNDKGHGLEFRGVIWPLVSQEVAIWVDDNTPLLETGQLGPALKVRIDPAPLATAE